jgi:hypothetical protein
VARSSSIVPCLNEKSMRREAFSRPSWYRTIARLFIVCFLAARFVKAADKPFFTPVVLSFSHRVFHAYPVPLKRAVGVEASMFGVFPLWVVPELVSPLSILSFGPMNILWESRFPKRRWDGSALEGIPSFSGPMLALREKYGYTVLDLAKKKKVAEITESPRSDVVAYVHKAVMVDNAHLLVVSLLSPSPDSAGELDPGLFSIVLKDLAADRELKRVTVGYKLSTEDPPVFFSPEVMIYKADRSEYDRPWLSLDKSLNPVRHPLARMLDEHLAKTYIFDMVISSRYQWALACCWDDAQEKYFLWLGSWKTGKSRRISFSFKDISIETKLMLSPSEKWVHFSPVVGDKPEDARHALVYVDSAGTSPLDPVVIANRESGDIVTWMTDPEGLVVFSDRLNLFWASSKVSWWNLAGFGPKHYSNGPVP